MNPPIDKSRSLRITNALNGPRRLPRSVAMVRVAPIRAAVIAAVFTKVAS